ncbi:metallophosphoesterase [Niabella defluvii]|nr:metallophosphoesterase [Niabella sp. I65]
MFSSFIYGLSNKYNYQVKSIKIPFANLPAAFKGLKIVHISDIHTGSFTNYKAVNKGIDLILSQNADLILFTGDLVNNKSNEVGEYQKIFSRLKAPMGVYSVLGNHDYGDYVQWKSPVEKAQNLEALKKYMQIWAGVFYLMNTCHCKRITKPLAWLAFKTSAAVAVFTATAA